MDEKSQIQALDRTQPLLPMRPGQAERRTHDYKRHGTTSLFAALELKTSRVIGQLHRRHRSTEFRKFLDRIEAQVPAAVEIHIIADNWFAELTNKRIRRGVFRSVQELETAIRDYIDIHNEAPKPFIWTRTADQILDSIARYAQRTIATPTSGLISRTIGTGD